MSSPTQPAASAHSRERATDRARSFWQRISEGRQIDDLWTQFVADARATYGFYGRDVDWEEIQKLRGWRKPLHVCKQFFWALLLKLSPTRRVILLLGFVFMVLSTISFRFGDKAVFEVKLEGIAALLFLLLVALELADKVTMKRDLEIAREIQTWLVPSNPPEVPNAEVAFASRPQNSVAGDYYDAFYPTKGAADGGKLMVVIADVAGKSIPAALLMATLQASLRTIAGEGAPLGDLVTRLNRYASAHSLEGRRFTTAVLAEYETETRRMSYVNAGHNGPVLRRANGALEKLETGGLPLGIRPDAAYEIAAVDLRPGDALIFYTDGVVEAFNEEGKEFGEDRWLEAVRALPIGSAQESLQFLMRRVDEYVGGTRQSDDITCLVFRSK
jgi:sigma-B regulation protein RsbU (phosphoserine phosphatase)